jgi:hypothetical protein
MPQINDAQITSVFSASITLDQVEDDEPNTPAAGGGAPVATFNVVLEAVAGNAVGNGGANYTLTLTCYDETTGDLAPASMSRTSNEQFNAADGWQLNAGAQNYFKRAVATITVPPGVRGHVFRYLAALVSDNNDIVSFKESNRFILV